MTNRVESSNEQSTDHVHRWRIGDQGGATSAGVCACGAEREFQNTWEASAPSWSGAKGGGRFPRK
ncbi:MAG: hypothetical protein WD557_09165 [Dehalococcoidia bacterium]